MANKNFVDNSNITSLITKIAQKFGNCATSDTVKNIVVVNSLPSDASSHTDTLYLIKET